ncbi:helix-turn-helix transcriptional regulator [Actinoplanes sp. URMC 104]|uniref:helix-turn-helix transcriptional regulator n=1 Tax=Actinoplanes sp. URMC 104 TaxID=3423409 RepID=UPI003F1A3137
MDRLQMSSFLRVRREALQPEEVGLQRGPRRRTGGLRREEVAALAGISADYYSRIEQQRGPMPSEQFLASLAGALHLSPFERDYLFQLGGFATRPRDHHDGVSSTLRRVLDGLTDAPALVMTNLGEVLMQNDLAKALIGDYTRFTGLSRYLVYRWFTDPAARDLFPVEDHRKRAGSSPRTCGSNMRPTHRPARRDRRGAARGEPRVRRDLAAARGGRHPLPRPQALPARHAGRAGAVRPRCWTSTTPSTCWSTPPFRVPRATTSSSSCPAWSAMYALVMAGYIPSVESWRRHDQ